MGVVVPVYNEAATIGRACRALVEVVHRYPGRALVVTVDDGSTDRSRKIMSDLAESTDVLEVEGHECNAGYGAALRTGAARARELGLEYVVFMDSDLTNPPEDLLTIGRLAEEGWPYIKGSRFVPGGGMVGVPPPRRAISYLGNRIASTLFGTQVRDVTNGFRAVRTDLFREWPLSQSDFSTIVEEFDWALRTGTRTVEFPTVLGARGDDQRRSAFGYSPRLLLSYLRYPLRALLRRLRSRFSRTAHGQRSVIPSSRLRR